MSRNNKILVITGGISNEKELSLISGEDVTRTLIKEDNKIGVEVLEITDNKQMFLYTNPNLFLEREKIDISGKFYSFKSIDFSILKKHNYHVAFLALDGRFGEDGHIQALLNLVNIPYTGSGIMASSIGMNKSKCYEFVSLYNINVPDYFLIYKHDYDFDQTVLKTKKNVGFPCVVKPNDSGSSIGVSLANSKNELRKSLMEAFKYSDIAIVQRFIRGREFACGVLGNTGYTRLEVLPVAESVIKDFTVYSHYQKYYAHETQDVCPAQINVPLAEQIMNNSELIHKILGCEGLSRSDFRYEDKEEKVYFLEINTSPGHTKNSICPQEARALGMTFGEFILKQIDLALKKKN